VGTMILKSDHASESIVAGMLPTEAPVMNTIGLRIWFLREDDWRACRSRFLRTPGVSFEGDPAFNMFDGVEAGTTFNARLVDDSRLGLVRSRGSGSTVRAETGRKEVAAGSYIRQAPRIRERGAVGSEHSVHLVLSRMTRRLCCGSRRPQILRSGHDGAFVSHSGRRTMVATMLAMVPLRLQMRSPIVPRGAITGQW
jgi:hypothetical protein